ncbi:hypothetical protein LOTGIDRAFT_236572 [Lottia gigantea]|uniref:Aldose 1-epimerase n=1 Tax=Lottia gigantea TaxID=225164 RepID=V3ZRQ7_LOTGI|nr:hypothetical protein LOTGIDRAFT_236572 [Lottia gigantea]ESO83566.1 hypothetical protein LOTGIDRAFT_236572 [Lottia gigantea]
MSSISQELFGKTANGRDVSRFILSNNNGLTIKILDYGGIITDILLPDNNGKSNDICLGFDDMEGYLTRSPYFGALIGRYANRIAGASFELDGKTYKLAANNGPNALHGGIVGFDKVLWTATIDNDKLLLKYISADGEEGYPGELTVTVIYELTADNELKLDYKATTTKATPVNLTNHTYFNLAGHESNNLNDHVITIPGHSYTVLDENTIPTGEIRPVDGTLLDLRQPVRLGDVLEKVNNGLGFDNNFHLPSVEGMQFGARIEHPPSGRYIECYTTEPGMQFYTCKNLKDTKGKNGVVYKRFGGFCLEAQHYPDSLHHANFPNTILREGDTYKQKTVYKFGVKM